MKGIIFTVVLSTISLISFAQFPDGPSVSIGIKGGVNFSTLNGTLDNDGTTKNMIAGGNFGLIANLGINKMVSLQPEILYLTSGTQYHNPGVSNGFYNYEYTVTDRFKYIQIPVLVKLSFGTDMVKFNFHLGPYVGMGLGGSRNVTGSAGMFGASNGYNKDYNIDVKKSGMAGFDFGAIIGVGLAVAAGPGSVFFDIRYNYGFLNVYDPDKDSNGKNKIDTSNENSFAGFYPNAAQTNSIISLSLGYMVTIGK